MFRGSRNQSFYGCPMIMERLLKSFCVFPWVLHFVGGTSASFFLEKEKVKIPKFLLLPITGILKM